MNVISDIIYNVGLLFIMMLPGFILKKCGMAPDGIGKGISNLVLYIAQPALIFLAYLRPYDGEILKNSLYVLILSIVAHVIFAVVAMKLFGGAPDGRRRMLRFATIFSNAAFMGIPLISAVLEDSFPGATLYASIYNITFNLFLWSLGVYICTKGRDVNADQVDDYTEVTKLKRPEDDDDIVKDSSGSIMKALLHPVTIAAAVGLIFFILPIDSFTREHAGIIVEAFTMLKNLVAPLSMTVIGLRLAEMSFEGMLGDKHMYLFLGLRHLALPLVMVGIIKLLGLVGLEMNYAVSAVVVILAACPAASSATMFAEKFNCDAVYVSRLVTVSTILSIATMPLILMLL